MPHPHCVAEQPEAHRVQGLAEVHLGSGVTELGSKLRLTVLLQAPTSQGDSSPSMGSQRKFWTDSRAYSIPRRTSSAHLVRCVQSHTRSVIADVAG